MVYSRDAVDQSRFRPVAIAASSTTDAASVT